MKREQGMGTGIASPDGLFGGRLTYSQPPKGFRSSVDSLALAFYVWSRSRGAPRKICDLGCGSGFLALTSALMWPQSKVIGVELSSLRATYARSNTQDNGMNPRVEILECDMRKSFSESRFDLILSNPPYHPLSSGTLPKDPDNAKARFEVALDLSALLETVRVHMSEKGSFFIVYPRGRWNELLSLCTEKKLSVAHFRPVHPTPDASPLLVVAEIHFQSEIPAHQINEPGNPLYLESEEKNLGDELQDFVGILSQKTFV